MQREADDDFGFPRRRNPWADKCPDCGAEIYEDNHRSDCPKCDFRGCETCNYDVADAGCKRCNFGEDEIMPDDRGTDIVEYALERATLDEIRRELNTRELTHATAFPLINQLLRYVNRECERREVCSAIDDFLKGE